jgi:pyruvate formate lyase activating enzyme
MHLAQLWKPLEDTPGKGSARVQCRLCNHFCRIEEGAAGRCGVRVNKKGALYSLVADKVAAINLDPVEKKPLYHFMPGTSTLSFGTMGCNLGCSFCQNYSLSQPPRQGRPVEGRPASPESLVGAAIQAGAPSISYTYSEPTVFFELMLGTAQLAVAKGLKNILVSNGFQSPECLEALGTYIHAANIDLKSFRDEFYRERCEARLQPVLDNLARMKKFGWWLETTTLVIPGLNDSDEELGDIARFLVETLGPDAPWHVSRFHPQYRLQDRPSTPVETLVKAWEIGRAAGLRYVYLGNVPGHEADNTHCPGCGRTLIERRGFALLKAKGKCPDCGAVLAGVDMERLG